MLSRYCITEWIPGLFYLGKAISFGEMPDPTKRWFGDGENGNGTAANNQTRYSIEKNKLKYLRKSINWKNKDMIQCSPFYLGYNNYFS